MPIPPADYSAPPSMGNRTLTNHGSQKRQRKRSRAGYQVEQTAFASNILPKHQQPPEQPLVPPIKLRRVHDGWRVVSSFAEQPVQETEPTITVNTEPLPIVVIRQPLKNPQPASGHILSTTSETTPTLVRENIEPMEDDDPADINTEALSMFLPEHQEALREHLINDNLGTNQHLKMVVQNAEKLLKMLRERKIELSKNRSKPPFPTLFSMLKAYSITETSEFFSTYFAKASVFFSAVNTNQIKNTGCLTSMLYTKSQITGFAEQSEEVIRYIASQPFLKQISSMRNNRGFPPKEEVETFMSIPCLKQGWQQGHDEAVQDKPIDRKLLMHIASMNHCKDFPTKERLVAFMTMPCLKQDWQEGNDEAVQDNPIDRELLMRIASMNNGKGFPTKKQVKAFMIIPCLRQGWQQGRDKAVRGKPIDRELLMRVASINSRKGFPTKAQVEAFMTIPCLRQGWQQGSDEAVRGKPIDRELLMRVASMNGRKGFPTKAQVEAFIAMPCLKEGWQQGSDEAALQGKPIDRELVTHIASMNNGKGFPTKAQVEAFMAMPCLRQDWQGCDEAVRDNPVDRELVTHIASMNNCNGFPTEAHTRAFIRWLPQENKKHCLKMASRVCASSGLPEQSVLIANERRLRQYLPDLPEDSIDSDDDISDSDNEPDHERAEDQQMKVLALFCSAPKKWRMNFAEFEQYLASFTNARNNDRTQVLSALASLLPMLFNHGGAGMRFWLARHNENRQDRRLLMKALSTPAPMDTAKFALMQLPESQCLGYIVLCRNLSPTPNKA